MTKPYAFGIQLWERTPEPSEDTLGVSIPWPFQLMVASLPLEVVIALHASGMFRLVTNCLFSRSMIL